MARRLIFFPPSWLRSTEHSSGLILAIVAVLFTLAAGLPAWHLRSDLQAQILNREARALQAMVELQLDRMKEEFSGSGLGGEVEDWFPLLLETSRLRGVVALRLHDATGTLRAALPAYLGEPAVAGSDWTRLRENESLAFLRRDASPQTWFAEAPQEQVVTRSPLLEVLVPLHPPGSADFSGMARYWIDGAAVQREFASLDHSLWVRVGLTVGLGLAVTLAALWWAFRRLALANLSLRERTDDLVRANREFNLVAKTSALGAITAHLMHGLRNPLAGLESFIAGPSLGADDSARRGADWQLAVETTARVRSLVNDVVTILREEQQGHTAFLVTLQELFDQASSRAAVLTRTSGLRLTTRIEGEAALSNRHANLVMLILDNLLRNACEATPTGKGIGLEALVAGNGRVSFLIRDEGPGLPPAMAGSLFQPVASQKQGGSGIGLAISRHLARHAGGDVEWISDGQPGCCFHLWVPVGSLA